MKKMLIVIMHLGMGGAEKSLVSFLNELRPEEAEIDLLLFKKRGELLKQVPDWVNILDTPKELAVLYGAKPSGGKGFFHALVRLIGTLTANFFSGRGERRNFIRWKYFYSRFIPQLEKKYDIAVSYLSGESLYYVVEKVNAENKFTWVHTDYRASGGCPADDRKYFEKLEKIITISEKCVEVIQEAIPEVADKVVCLPNIVSSDLIRKKSLEFVPEEYSEKEFKILTVGRLEKVKGIDLAVDAAGLLKEKCSFVWYVIGEGSERGVITSRIKELGLEGKFVLMGVKENPYPYIKNCDLIVKPSRFEGKSIALDEAKILGRAIVATAYPAVGDQLTEKEGIVVDMSPDGIAEGILEMINNYECRRNIENYLECHEYGNVSVKKEYLEYFNI